MSILSELPQLGKRSAKRLGRGLGSGKGAKSARGTTRHQKARKSIPLFFEGGQARLVKKYPLLRGKGKNKSVQRSTFPINVSLLNVFNDSEKVTMKSLIEKGLIDQRAHQSVKILGDGKLEKKLIVALPVSQKAKALIEKAGGSVEGYEGHTK